jgi:hypothetical protein
VCLTKAGVGTAPRAALAGALGCAPDWIGIADQAQGFDWRALE